MHGYQIKRDGVVFECTSNFLSWSSSFFAIYKRNRCNKATKHAVTENSYNHNLGSLFNYSVTVIHR